LLFQWGPLRSVDVDHTPPLYTPGDSLHMQRVLTSSFPEVL
jgi:hypothetical protein